MKKYIGIILYNLIAKYLPKSYSRVNIGQRFFEDYAGNLF